MKKNKIKKWLSERNPAAVNEDEIKLLSGILSNRFIDRQTASDLLLYEYSCSIDTAVTTPGRNILYAILRCPLSDESEIIKRREFILKLAADRELQQKMKKNFFKIKSSETYSVNPVLFENKNSLFTREKLAFFLLIFILSVITIPLLFPNIAVFSILFFLLCSFLIFAANFSIYNRLIPGLIYLGSHYNTAQKTLKLLKAHNIENDYTEKLTESLSKTKVILPVVKIISTGSFTSGDPLQLVLFWIKNIFCLDLLAYNKAIGIINSRKDDFLEFYCRYGLIDALLSVAQTVKELEGELCRPVFNTDASISADRICHPLVEDAVSNSISISKGMILTGSNMAGKSTFLRTIGLNAVLAQSMTFCYAESLVMPVSNIVSIINKHDDISRGESFYFYEAKRISGMINRAGSDRYIFLIDELLSGTNSLERVSASVSIIRYLFKIDSIISFIATHDISIAKNLEQECSCYYFSDKVKDGIMIFDYQLKNGIIKTTNAIRMLRELGLPGEITDSAEELTKNFNT